MPNIDPHRMTDPADVARFITAGKAYFTLRSAKTGTRYTYRVRASDDGRVHFVGVLTGTDNDTHYSYVGMLRGGMAIQLTGKSKFGLSDPQVLAVDYLLRNVGRSTLPEKLEFWHEGRCACCGRRLTVPESITNGIGPECIKRYRKAA